MLSTTVNMWLGIAFVFLAIVATLLQAWLWSYPMDPPDDPRGRSLAPRSWTNVHRAIGALYVVIYVVLMTQMVPRLWTYQVELPARTVMHATMGIVIGVLLLAKFSIIRLFKHFGKALPAIGLGLLTCTLILATLSVPFALRAHALGADLLEPQNKERLVRVLKTVELGTGVEPEALATETALVRGRHVLTTQCTVCHDMRTILIKPRTGKGWHDLVVRMVEKPSFGPPIRPDDVPYVTAYLVALSPSLQESKEKLYEAEARQAASLAELRELDDETSGETDEAEGDPAAGAPPGTPPASSTPPGEAGTSGAQPGAGEADTGTTVAKVVVPRVKKPRRPRPPIDMARAKKTYEAECSQCHKLSTVDRDGGHDRRGWTAVIKRMIKENDAVLTAQQVREIAAYLAKEKPKEQE